MIPKMPLTPSFLIAAAGGFVGVKEEGGNNRGEMVDRFLASVKLRPGLPWCAAFVYHVGYWSHYDHEAKKTVWPLPQTASCWKLGEFARKKKILEKEPMAGDVFLIYNKGLGRFSHTGIVVKVLFPALRENGDVWPRCMTIDGNTNEEGSREGNVVALKPRTFFPDEGDRFIRWVKMDKRNEAGNPDEGMREAA